MTKLKSNVNGKLKLIVKYAGKEMTSLESDNATGMNENLTVELEELIIKLGICIDEAMKKTGITKEQLQKTIPKERYAHYSSCKAELKIIVNYINMPFVSTNANDVLPHQIRQAFDGMTQSIQNSLDNLIRNQKLTDNSFPTRDLNKF